MTALTKKGTEISFIRYGNSEVAKSTDHTHFNYFEDSLIDWTRATFPLGPRPLAPDLTAPSFPTNLTAAAASNSQVNLSWTLSSDNVGVAGYRIFRDGVQVALTTSVASYTDTGLVGLTSYSYTVSAYDFAGNASAQSFPPTLVTTPDVPFDFTLSHGGNKSVARGSTGRERHHRNPNLRRLCAGDLFGNGAAQLAPQRLLLRRPAHQVARRS